MAKEIIHIPASKKKGTQVEQKNRLRVAAYCRVSSEQDQQLNSFENQVAYYTEYIERNPEYVMAGIYADEGISGTNTRKRSEFNRMIRDCEAGLIDLVITKSISRFARNTQDCLHYSRMLKDMGIGIIFEKENVDTTAASGELLLQFWHPLHKMRAAPYRRTWCGANSHCFHKGSGRCAPIAFTAMTKTKKGTL